MGGHRAGLPRRSLWTALLIVLQAYGQAQPWVLLTDTPVAQTEPTLYACRNWIEQGFRGLKTVGWKWHKTRRLDPTRVGRHWLVLATATLLAVAYGTRREEAEARHLPPGRLRRPPAELDAAHQAVVARRAATASCSRAWRCCAACCYAAICGPACGCGRRPAPTSARACAGWTPAAPEPTRAFGAGPASHSSIALSTPRPLSALRTTRPATPALPPPRGLSALKTAGDSRPNRRLWPCHARGGPTDPDALHQFPSKKYPCQPLWTPAGCKSASHVELTALPTAVPLRVRVTEGGLLRGQDSKSLDRRQLKATYLAFDQRVWPGADRSHSTIRGGPGPALNAARASGAESGVELREPP